MIFHRFSILYFWVVFANSCYAEINLVKSPLKGLGMGNLHFSKMWPAHVTILSTNMNVFYCFSLQAEIRTNLELLAHID